MTELSALCGRLGTNPVAGWGRTGDFTQVGMAVVGLGDESKETRWVQIMAFGAEARNLSSCGKGDLVAAVGKLEMNHWQDKHGKQRRKWQLTVKHLHIIHRARRTKAA